MCITRVLINVTSLQDTLHVEAMAEEQFSVVWNSFPKNLSSGLFTLLADEQLVDVTLAAEGQILRAHKLILSVCSTYFRELFKVSLLIGIILLIISVALLRILSICSMRLRR